MSYRSELTNVAQAVAGTLSVTPSRFVVSRIEISPPLLAVSMHWPPVPSEYELFRQSIRMPASQVAPGSR